MSNIRMSDCVDSDDNNGSDGESVTNRMGALR